MNALEDYRKSGWFNGQRMQQTTAGSSIFTVKAVEKSLADAAVAELKALCKQRLDVQLDHLG